VLEGLHRIMQEYEVFYSLGKNDIKNLSMMSVKAENAWDACKQVEKEISGCCIQYVHPVV